MEKQKLIYVESKAQFSPSSVPHRAIVFIKDTKEIWTHGTYFICSNVWATPITLTLSGDSTGSVSIDGSGNVTLSVTNQYLDVGRCSNDANSALSPTHKIQAFKEFAPSFANGFPATNYANAIININTHSQNYDHQLGFSSNKGIYHRTRSGGTWETSWRELLTSTNYTNYPHTFASLTNKPTTISGYGITDSIPIITGGQITTDTNLSTLGMTTTGAKLSVFHSSNSSNPDYMYKWSNALMFRSTTDTYGVLSIDTFDRYVTFIGGRNQEAISNNAPIWWYRLQGNSGTTYDLNSFQNTINNLDNNYLRKSGGTMTGTLTLKGEVNADAANTGALNANNSNIYGLNGLYFADIAEKANEGINFYRSSTTVDSLWGKDGILYWTPNKTYGSDGNNQKVLTSGNFTEYAVAIQSANQRVGSVPVFNYPYLSRHSALNFAYFYPDDNNGATSYLLIAELTNYGTGANTKYIEYGISGTLYSYRGGNANNNHVNNVTAIVSVGPYTSSKIYSSAIKDTLIPMIVTYNNKYYIALKKTLSGTGFYFLGIALNLLSPFIKVNDSSLITEVTRPQSEISTSNQYYNGGDPKYYLHEGNYSTYALPLSGGTLTGNINWNTDSHGIYLYHGCGIEKWEGYGPTLIAEGSSPDFYIRNNTDRTNYYKIIHTGNYSSYALPLSGGTLTGTLTSSSIVPRTSVTYDIGTTSAYYNNIYAQYFKRKDSSNSYVLLGGGGHKLLSDLSSVHTHDWSSITSKPGLLGAMANPIFYPYANDSKLGVYISTINNRFYSADLRYTVTTTGFASGNVHYLFDDNYNSRMQINMGTTATITIEGYNFVYNNGYIMIYFYLHDAYPLKWPKSITAKATKQNGTVYTLNRATSVESGNTIAFQIGLEYLTKVEFTIVAQDNAYCGITNIDYYSRRTEDSGRDCAVVTKYNANTLYYNLTAPKYIVTNGTSSQFLKADGSLDSTSYLKTDGSNGTSDGVSTLLNKLTTGGSTPVDADYYICQWAGGGTTTTSYHRRPMSAMYAYIKSKATSDFLPLAGGTLGSSSASSTVLYLQSSTAKLRLLAWNDGYTYIQSGNSAFNGNAPLKLSGYNNNTGSDLYFNFTNIYCRGSNYINIDSGNYSSYALPLSGGTLTGELRTSKSIYAASFYESSDIRLKENVGSIDQSDLMKNVDLVQFNFKDNQTKKYGVIAQQLEAVGLNNLVYDNDGNKAVDYISLLVLEMQRLRNEIADLREKLNNKEQTS